LYKNVLCKNYFSTKITDLQRVLFLGYPVWHRRWNIILSSLGLSGTLLGERHCTKLRKISILPCQICWSTHHIHWYRPVRSLPLLYQRLSGAKRYHWCTLLVRPGKPSGMGLFYQLNHATISIIGQTTTNSIGMRHWISSSKTPKEHSYTHISSGRWNTWFWQPT